MKVIIKFFKNDKVHIVLMSIAGAIFIIGVGVMLFNQSNYNPEQDTKNEEAKERAERIKASAEEHDRQIQFEKAEEFEEVRKILEEDREKEKERFER